MRIGIDIGGTFTDFVIFDEATGEVQTHKLPSTPKRPAEAVLQGLKEVDAGASPYIIHGSTVATNALLERKGAKTALIATKGFRDVLAIGRQTRPELYNFFVERPTPLVPEELRLEVNERVDSSGNVITPLEEEELEDIVTEILDLNVDSVAVCLLFSFLYPEHERRIARRLRKKGFYVSFSSEILPEFREYERSSTTVINAYVAPIMGHYIAHLEAQLKTPDFYIMQSNGGTIRSDKILSEPVRAILSGPAGGVVGAQYVAGVAGFESLITFDMGGTSTDVSLCDGEIRVTHEGEIGGFPVRIPVVDVHTVGSGGGSIARLDAGGVLRVGPSSAGAEPGPVCYGRGGTEPTVTDANLVLGRLAADSFLGGRMELDPLEADAALAALAKKAQLHPLCGLSSAQTAALGVIQVANAHMERALRVISVERGHDPQDFILVSFGGAGGLHAADLARAMGIPRVFVPKGASTLSAFGMIAADLLKDYVQTVMLPGDTFLEELEQRFKPLVERGMEELCGQGVPVNRVSLFQEVDMRYVGQGYEISVPLKRDFERAFHDLHKKRYGHSSPGIPVEIVSLRLRAVGTVPKPTLQRENLGSQDPSQALLDYRPVVLVEGKIEETPFFTGEDLRPGNILTGPAVVVYQDTTVYLAEGDRAWVDEGRNLVVEVACDA
jgi:N-methylhydantoinase A